MKFYFISILIAIFIIVVVVIIRKDATSGPGQDQTSFVEKNGSVETSVSIQHADKTHDVILTSHKVWLHDSVYADLLHHDTIPALDSIFTRADDKNGESTSVRVQKDYQLFITVK